MFLSNFLMRCFTVFGVIAPTLLFAQNPPYDVFPEAAPPYYRVRMEAPESDGLQFSANFTIWVPENVKRIRGVVVHQHGCGEGSCKSGLTGAYDLHWQALARKHGCALLAPSYEQPEGTDCQLWCDPRNGSAAAFQQCLVELGKQSGHPELAKVPWALWGHSGGGHWAGGMVLLYPQRVVAAWLRSGVPLVEPNPDRTDIKSYTLPDEAFSVPMMCNLGTKEGVTVTDGRFSRVWPANKVFFKAIRQRDGLIGVAIDPLTSHECGNQRYLAIPWLDACLNYRLPNENGEPLRAMPVEDAMLADPTGIDAFPVASYEGDPKEACWLPNQTIARRWEEYVKDTNVTDTTLPPAPTHAIIDGNVLTWEAKADVESGLAHFIIERDGKVVSTIPADGKNRFGRTVFQNLQYSDTPTQPLVRMRFVETSSDRNITHSYSVISVNTVGLKSKPTVAQVAVQKPWKNGANTIVIDDLQRDFLLDVPTNLKPGAALVFVFHGYTSTAASIRRYSGFSRLATEQGFVAVYPQGTRDSRGKNFHNVGYAFHSDSQVDDVKFARTLSDRLVSDLQLDANAVFATGMSNGGDMSYFLASQKAVFVRAIAPVAGTMMKSWSDFKPTVRLPVLHVHGTSDKVTLWHGDPDNRDGWGAYLPLDDVLRTWVDGMKLEKESVSQLAGADDNRPSIHLHRWSTDVDRTEVRLYKIENGLHVWPKDLGNPQKTTSEVIWDFFKSHR